MNLLAKMKELRCVFYYFRASDDYVRQFYRLSKREIYEGSGHEVPGSIYVIR
jgi:hypothetical protein